MTQSSLAETLRVLRARRDLTITDAASRIGITRETLRDLEHGTRNPYYPTLEKIARAYGVSVEQLMLPAADAELVAPPKAQAPPETREDEERRGREEIVAAGAEGASFEEPAVSGSREQLGKARARLAEHQRDFDEFERRAARIEAGDPMPGGPLELGQEVSRRAAVVEVELETIFPKSVLELEKRAVRLLDRMIRNYEAQQEQLERLVKELEGLEQNVRERQEALK